MNEGDSENDSSRGLVLTPKMATIFVICIPAFFFLLDDIFGLINGGGIFSVTSALAAAGKHSAVINVDSAGLRTVFVLLCSIAVTTSSSALRANLSDRLACFVIIFSIIGGAFIIDAMYDESIVGHFLANHGYSRCRNGDFEVGNGKSRVWFDDYVLSQTSCPPTPHFGQ